MSKKSWNINRRTFLYGSGVACALPWLEAMASEKSSAKQAPKRLCYLYFPNGCSNPSESEAKNIPLRWFPRGEGTKYQVNKPLSPLKPFRQDISIIGGLSHPNSRTVNGHIAGDTFLTGGDLSNTYNNSISVDQVAARTLGKDTRYPFFSFSVDGGVGYKSRSSTLSYDQSGNPIPTESNHREIFERYFSPNNGGATGTRRKEIQSGRKIVDLVLESSKDLSRRLGKNDQQKMDEYLSSLNSVEEQLKRNEAWLSVPLKKVDSSHINLDADPAKSAEEYIRTMYDLIVLGYQMDLTRVISYMIAREDGLGLGDKYPLQVIKSLKGHHAISHANNYEVWAAYDEWLSKQFAYFIGRMKTTKDEYGSLLDNTQVLYGSACSTTHSANNLPLIVAGGKNMGLKHGAFTKFSEKTPMSNLFVSMLNAAGVKKKSFKDSTGELPAGIFS